MASGQGRKHLADHADFILHFIVYFHVYNAFDIFLLLVEDIKQGLRDLSFEGNFYGLFSIFTTAS